MNIFPAWGVSRWRGKLDGTRFCWRGEVGLDLSSAFHPGARTAGGKHRPPRRNSRVQPPAPFEYVTDNLRGVGETAKYQRPLMESYVSRDWESKVECAMNTPGLIELGKQESRSGTMDASIARKGRMSPRRGGNSRGTDSLICRFRRDRARQLALEMPPAARLTARRKQESHSGTMDFNGKEKPNEPR